jgi:hypothetical protein
MRTSLKHLIVALAVVLAGGMTLSAQHRGSDRLPRLLDPLGILPSPRQVIRSLDHVARTVPPPLVIESRGYPGYDYDCDGEYRSYPIRYYARDYRSERYEQRSHRRPPVRFYDHDRPRGRGWQ